MQSGKNKNKSRCFESKYPCDISITFDTFNRNTNYNLNNCQKWLTTGHSQLSNHYANIDGINKLLMDGFTRKILAYD